ncbi:MAG: ATP-binding protein, partial [Peptostreptococcaceae bacterium]
IKAIKEKESIYSVIGSSLFMFSIKSIYSIAGKIYTNPAINLTSVSITYLGFITIILGLFVEIIQSKKKNEYLKEELELFYKIIDESGHSAKIICDEKGEFIYANKSALKYYLDKYDVNLNDIINKKIDKKSIIHNEKEYYENEDIIEKELEKNNKYSFEMKIDDRYIECFIQRIKKKEKNYKIVSFRDITDRHEMEKTILEYEKVKQQELVRNEFFANISHELKTPINILYSTIQLLTYKSSEPNFKEIYLKHMKSLRMNCQRMLRLIDNIVDITKFETGYKIPEFKNYDIIRLVEEISLSVINYAKRKNINLIFDTEIEELKIKCDQDMIERVMLNLLSNAIKFTEIGGNIKVYMKADKDWVHISVIDDGVGIPPESQPYVFERFVQVDKSIRRKNEGSGIGLSIVKSIIDLNDGHICLKSDGKNGCEFKVLLPNKVMNDNEIKENTNKNLDIQKIQLELSDIYEVYET